MTLLQRYLTLARRILLVLAAGAILAAATFLWLLYDAVFGG